MSTSNMTAFWHKESFDRFIHERLPQLLAMRLPLAGYGVEEIDTYRCRVVVTLAAARDTLIEVAYEDLPQPDSDGVFSIAGHERVVVPRAAHSDLDTAEIACVGEMLYGVVDEQLGEAPENLPWDAALLRAWLPLDRWLNEFMHNHPHAQVLDTTNWLARQTHLRRLSIQKPTALTTLGQFGRVCLFEAPEGPNLGRIFVIARGAAIRNGKLVVTDTSPGAYLGLSASMIPCLEHNDPNRLLMGANMMRQWLPYDEPEPALVQSGFEPAAPDFWCGRNLLTAFIPWGGDTFEDGIVLSKSGARHLSNGDRQIEPGDKLSNRHGSKGVVSRILPDDQMPCLADGTPIELIFSGVSLLGRQNTGQLREAVLGRLAHAEGTPSISMPFQGSSMEEIGNRLVSTGAAKDGRETLIRTTGEPLALPSTVGWVYWGRTVHLASEKLQVAVTNAEDAQRQGEMEYAVLRQIGALATIDEHFNTRAGDSDHLQERLTQHTGLGLVEQAGPPAPRFAMLQKRLSAAGIEMILAGEQLRFRFAPPGGTFLELAHSVPHPWLSEHLVSTIGAFPVVPKSEPRRPDWRPAQPSDLSEDPPMPEFIALAEANARLAHLLQKRAPQSLVDQAAGQVETQLYAYLGALLSAADVGFDSRVLFSGRAVLAPGPELGYDQVGLPEEMAWALFGPFVASALGDVEAVIQRTAEASTHLDALLARHWVLVHQAPSLSPNAFVALRPIREPGHALRLHPFACRLLDADFDGDQAAIFLPITAEGQQEAGALLSIRGHLTRDSQLLQVLAPWKEAMWGLAWLSLTAEGRDELAALVGRPLLLATEFVTRADLSKLLEDILTDRGVEPMLAILDQLWRRGFAVAGETGLSLSPFVGATWSLPPTSAADDPARWQEIVAQFSERLLAYDSYTQDFGPYILAIKSGAIPDSHLRALANVLGAQNVVQNVCGEPTIVHHGYRDGLILEDFLARVPGARAGLAQIAKQWEQAGRHLVSAIQARSFHALARARRAEQPGIVFARAAATREMDPLVDIESRLFVGLGQSEGHT